MSMKRVGAVFAVAALLVARDAFGARPAEPGGVGTPGPGGPGSVLIDGPRARWADGWAEVGRRGVVPLMSPAGGTLTDLLLALKQARPAGSGSEGDERIHPAPLLKADLDGDGLDDILTAEFRYAWSGGQWEGRGITITSRRGTDGLTRWTRVLFSETHAPDQIVLYLMPDLDDDGSADLLIVEKNLSPSPLNFCDEVCATTTEGRWDIIAVGGSTGDDVWSRAIPSVSRWIDAGSTPTVVTGQAAYVIPLASGDHDEDGGADVVLNTISTESVDDGPFPSPRPDHHSIATRAEVVNGRTGATILESQRDAKFMYPVLEPLGNVSGTDAPELAWVPAATTSPVESWGCVPATGPCVDADEADRTVVDLLEGSTLDVVWSVPLEDPVGREVEVVSRDLDGDAVPDLVVRGYSTGEFDWGRDLRTIGAISGATGERLWERQFAGDYFWFDTDLGSIGGTDGDDILVVEAAYYDNWDAAQVIHRVDGGTGTDLLLTEFFRVDWLQAMGDADGDGAADLFVEQWIPDSDESLTTVQSGRTGDALYAGSFDAWTFAVGDLDGDGGANLIRITFDWLDPGYVVTLEGVSPLTGAVAWSIQTQLPGANSVSLWPMLLQDATGDGRDDVLFSYSLDGYSDDFRTRMDLHDGATGAVGWIVETQT